VTGQSLGTFFAEQVAGPLGADFHIGTPAEHDARVARVIPPPPMEVELDPDGIAARAMATLQLDASQSWDEAWRRAEIPAAGGHGNARSVAAVQAVMACEGEVDGVRLLSPEGCATALRVQIDGTDLVLGMPLRHGIGYGLPSAQAPLSPSERACFWGGWGGSLVLVDLDQRMVVSYVMNRMGEGTTGDLRGVGLVFAAYASLAGRA
jgi:CubicO group peptidase (beta-lactamase class C family)